jgi:hypothetical protein
MKLLRSNVVIVPLSMDPSGDGIRPTIPWSTVDNPPGAAGGQTEEGPCATRGTRTDVPLAVLPAIEEDRVMQRYLVVAADRA